MIPFPNKKYNIIYADPAWTYRVWSKKGAGRTASAHYTVSSLDEMKELPIQNIYEDDSVLFMWATYPNLKEALELGEAWGFEYKTVAFTWIKRNKKSNGFFVGMGYYTRANAEICLLFTRGKVLPRQSKSVRQICSARIRNHSQKPDEIRGRIVALFGDLPRIELFARQSVPGWDTWGNEVTKFDNEWHEKEKLVLQGLFNES